MTNLDDRSEQFEAEVRRRIGDHLERRRDTAPDGPGLDVEDYRALEQGFAWEILNEPGWQDVQALWRDRGLYAELEALFGSDLSHD